MPAGKASTVTKYACTSYGYTDSCVCALFGVSDTFFRKFLTFYSAAPSLAVQHYHAMNVKQVQNDTLSHFILARASTFSLAASGDIGFTQECIEASNIYVTNSADVSVASILRDKTSVLTSSIIDCGIHRPSLCYGEVFAGTTF